MLIEVALPRSTFETASNALISKTEVDPENIRVTTSSGNQYTLAELLEVDSLQIQFVNKTILERRQRNETPIP